VPPGTYRMQAPVAGRSADLNWLAICVVSGNSPSAFGSGQFGTPWERIHRANRTRACMLLAVGGGLFCTSGGSLLAMDWQACWMLDGTSGASCGQAGALVNGSMTGSGQLGMP